MYNQKRKWQGSNNWNKRKSKSLSMEYGMKGFLCTCNFKERDCIREAYKLLEEYDTELDTKKKIENVQETEQEHDNEDICDLLKKEIQELNAQTIQPLAAKRFQYIDTKVKNVIFMNTIVSDPLALALRIIKDIEESKMKRSRFIIRLIPILEICKADLNVIKLKASAMCEKYFAQEPKKFAIVFNRHCNNTIQRNKVIETLAAVISEKNPGNRTDLKNPEIAVIVEIIKTFCLLSIAPEYFRYKKYNLIELCNVTQGNSLSEEATDLQKTPHEAEDVSSQEV